ncbi:hypothetical protein LCGC14_1913240, partial [marine sediment metagenome]
MMIVEQLLLQLKESGIRLTLKQGKLLVHANKAVLNDELKTQLKEHKEAIIRYLSNNNTEHHRPVASALRAERIPLSFSQYRLWFIDSLQGMTPEYNMPLALKVEGQFDVAVAQQALKKIIARHEVLRTNILDDRGVPYQVIQDDFEFHVERYDLTADTLSDQQTKSRQLISELIVKPFDLKNDLMVRCAFIHTIGENILLFNMHHIASDGWSFGVLVREFTALYEAIENKKDDPLPQLTIQYADYAQWQRDYLSGDVLSDKLDYWRTKLSDLPIVHSLPLDFPRPTEKQVAGEVVVSKVDLDVKQRLSELAKAQKMTPFMLLHAALALVLSRHSHNHDIVIGTPIANRTHVELESLIGFFVNTLVLRVNTDFDDTEAYLTHVKEVHREAQNNQDLPFDKLLEHLDVPRVSSHAPIFQILFSMEVNSDGDLSIPRVNFSQLSNTEELVQFDLDIKAKITPTGINVYWKFDTVLFTRSSIQSLAEHLNTLLSNLVNAPLKAVSKLPIMSEEELHYLTHQLNQNAAHYPQASCVHSLFEQQAQVQPDAIAVRY